MTAIKNSPRNLNMLAQNNFLYQIERCPGVAYFSRNVELPGMTLTHARENTPFATIPVSGDNISFGTLSITFLVDEDLNNYFSIVDWLYGLAGPVDFVQRQKFIEEKGKPHSEITLLIMDQQKKTHYSVRYSDCLPTSISNLSLVTDNTTTEYQTATATFVYSYYDYEKLYDYGLQESQEIIDEA
jgi:hypothetical protein